MFFAENIGCQFAFGKPSGQFVQSGIHVKDTVAVTDLFCFHFHQDLIDGITGNRRFAEFGGCCLDQGNQLLKFQSHQVCRGSGFLNSLGKVVDITCSGL